MEERYRRGYKGTIAILFTIAMQRNRRHTRSERDRGGGERKLQFFCNKHVSL